MKIEKYVSKQHGDFVVNVDSPMAGVVEGGGGVTLTDSSRTLMNTVRKDEQLFLFTYA